MFFLLIHLFFILFSIYSFVQVLSYGIYEIKLEKNKFGGIFIIIFSLVVIVFANIFIWFRDY